MQCFMRGNWQLRLRPVSPQTEVAIGLNVMERQERGEASTALYMYEQVANQRPSASLGSGVLAINSVRKSMKARILSGRYFRLTYTKYSVGPCTG